MTVVGIQVFTHAQTLPTATWVIDHNFTHLPTCDVFIDYGGSLQKVLPLSVSATTENQLVIKFSSAQSGVARLS